MEAAYVDVWPTNNELCGVDNSGRRVSRKVYEDYDGNEYVSIGRYAMSNPRALVTLGFFAEHIMSFCYVVERN